MVGVEGNGEHRSWGKMCLRVSGWASRGKDGC